MVRVMACGLTNAVNLLNPETLTMEHRGFFIPEHYLKELEMDEVFAGKPGFYR